MIIVPAIAIAFTLGAILGAIARGPRLGRRRAHAAPVAREVAELRAQVAALSSRMPEERVTVEAMPPTRPTRGELGPTRAHHREGGMR